MVFMSLHGNVMSTRRKYVTSLIIPNYGDIRVSRKQILGGWVIWPGWRKKGENSWFVSKKKPFKPHICASYLAQQAKDSRHFFLVCGIVNSHGALDPPWPWRRHLARTCVVVVLFLALDLQQNGKSSNRTSPCPCKSWFSTLSPTHSASSS